ncbi:hypothetical protein QYM36_006958, partial [Artemia franciscana]
MNFSSTAARDLWWSRLHEGTERERQKEPTAIPIQVVYYDNSSGVECVKTLAVGANDTAKDCIRMALSHMELPDIEPSKYQLWASTTGLGGDEAPYPLIGHEVPFAIRMHCARAADSDEEGGFQNNSVRCQFVLRSSQKELKATEILSPKKSKKNRRSPMKFQQVFRRASSKGEGLNEGKTRIFGQSLPSICDGGKLPQPIMEILQQLAENGPSAVGIFRKSANARQIREIREHIDNGVDVDIKQFHVIVLAVLLKDFLRSLPDSLLMSSKYCAWIEACRVLPRIKSLCEQLPASNRSLLRHLLCVLHRVARKSPHNLMSANNLAICIGPSLLWPSLDGGMSHVTPENSKQVPLLVTMLIEHCGEIFGPETLWLFDRVPEYLDFKQVVRRERSDLLPSSGRCSAESGTGESPSFFQERRIGELRRDDSSVDSLERDLVHVESDEHPGDLRRNKHSVTNLSRDSGLTLSDTQLNVDEEEGNESSASSSRKSNYSSSGCGSDPRWDQSPYENLRKVHIPYESVYKGKLSRTENVIYGTKLSDKFSSGYVSPIADDIYAVPRQSIQPVMNSDHSENHRRQELFRRRSALRREIRNKMGCDVYDDVGGLRRSTSDESLASMTKLNSGARVRRQTKTQPDLKNSPKVSRTYISSEPIYGRTRPSLSTSTPHMEDVGDSSTLSDDDLTPHVSRSNSRGKEWETRSVPPTYEETMTRQTVAKKLSIYQEVPRHSQPFSLRVYEPQRTDSANKFKEAQAKRVDTVRQYNQTKEQKLTNVHCQGRANCGSIRDIPPTLPPKMTPPPLPPKQRTKEEIKLYRKESIKRQRPVTVHIDTNFLSSLRLTNENPPLLPPKERHRSKTDNVRREREIHEAKSEKKELNTKCKAKTDMAIQTYDFETDKSDYSANEFMRDQSCQTSGSWLNLDKISDEQPEEIGGERVRGPSERLRSRDRSKKVSRSQSLPGQDEEQSQPRVINATREEINWSVTKLRALFSSDSQRSDAKGSTRKSKRSDSVESAMPRYARVNTLKAEVREVIEILKNEGWILKDKMITYEGFLNMVRGLSENEFIVDFHLEYLLVFHSNSDFHDHELLKTGAILFQDKVRCLVFAVPRYARVNALKAEVREVIEILKNEGWILKDKMITYEGFLNMVRGLSENEFIVDFHLEYLLVFHSNSDFHDHELLKTGAILLQDKAEVREVIEILKNEGWILKDKMIIYEGFLNLVRGLSENEFIVDFHLEYLLVFHSNSDFHDHELLKTGAILLQDKVRCLVFAVPRYARVNTLKAEVREVIEILKNEGWILKDKMITYEGFLNMVRGLSENEFIVDFHLEYLLVFHSNSDFHDHELLKTGAILFQDKV